MKKIKLKKRRNKLRFKRKMVLTSTLVLLFVLGIGYSFLSVDLNILGNITVRKSYGNTLYEVLEKEAALGGVAKEYTGLHQDSMDGVGSEKIYHWTNNYSVLEKNNVIFANHCWNIIRTTDTGGVKLLYNGEVEDGQCLNTRGHHVGYDGDTTVSLLSTYYYGTDYVYDKNNNVFSLSGTVTTGTIQTGQYTCRSTSSTGTCSRLYLIDEFDQDSDYSAFSINGNSNYDQYGTLRFNQSNKSLADVGYMYNQRYIIDTKTISKEGVYSQLSINMSYYYADSYDWNTIITDRYTLTNSFQLSSTDDYTSLVGKYTFKSTSSTYSSSSIYYIVAVNGSNMYCIQLSNGNGLSYYNYTFTYGDSYIDNGNGTYTITNPVTIDRLDYNTHYNEMSSKYACKDAINNVCNDLIYVSYSSNMYQIDFLKQSNNYKYAESFSYDSSTDTYTLDGDSVEFWNVMDSTNSDSLKNHHYTCFNTSGVCNEISYVFSTAFYTGIIAYISLTQGKGIEDAIDEMLYNNVNQNDSIIKKGVDNWYKKYLNSYSNQLEDTIFCNDRSIKNLYGWDPNGGKVTNALSFRVSNDLSCINETDKFSVDNNSAKLTYPIGLMSNAEMIGSFGFTHIQTLKNFWLITPHSLSYNAAYGMVDGGAGTVAPYYMNANLGIRPAISLRPGIEYISGTGSKTDPYVVNTFQDDDWATIVNNVRNGKTGNYQVGDTKEVDMGSLGTHTLRIVNKSTLSECNNSSFSQTACGFVLEFADVLSIQKMNSTSTNVGGWPATQLRTYINSDIYNALPSDLKNGIIDTRVVSGHGSSNSNNFTSTDKLYLQAVKELYGVNVSDSASNNTRQLDYYSNMGIHAANIKAARKYNSNYYYFWLISPNSSSTSNFYNVDSSGAWEGSTAATNNGVSPAFRIG